MTNADTVRNSKNVWKIVGTTRNYRCLDGKQLQYQLCENDSWCNATDDYTINRQEIKEILSEKESINHI